jgi:ribosome-associated protein
MFSKLLDQVDYNRIRSVNTVKLADDPLVPMVEAIVSAADKRKASVVSAFRVFELTEVTTFMVVIEGNSAPQNQAIALSIEEDVPGGVVKKEGTAASGWILMDYGSVIVHIMTPQMRNFYKLERRWKDAEVTLAASPPNKMAYLLCLPANFLIFWLFFYLFVFLSF